jgi:hypothetical protein
MPPLRLLGHTLSHLPHPMQDRSENNETISSADLTMPPLDMSDLSIFARGPKDVIKM